MIIYLDSMMRNSEAKNIPDSLGNYYASNRATAIINYNNYSKNISQDQEIAYLIPKPKVNLTAIMRFILILQKLY